MTDTDPLPPVTAQLADFASTLKWDAVPSALREFMPVLLIDFFRVAALGFDKPWTRAASELHRGGTGSATASVAFSGERLDAPRAAFMNAVAAGGLEWDDSHAAAIVHPGVVVWPAALALAETVGASGRDLLTAAVAGYEVAIRVGMSVQPEHSLRGFQGTSTCGVFGAAAASARLLGLDPGRARDALGIAASFSCGLSQFFVSGSDVKRVHAGRAAASGMEAALLAKAGISGPHDAIEGVQGFGRAFSDRFDARTTVRDLGTWFPTMSVALKPHAGSVRMQAAIEAAVALAREGVTPGNVQAVEIGVHPAMMGKLSSNNPRDLTQAQLSVPFAVAMAIALAPGRGSQLALSSGDFGQCLGDERVRALSARITCAVDAEVERLTSADGVPARVTCLLRDGTRREKFVQDVKGSPQNPLTQQEVCERFLASAASRFARSDIESWLGAALGIETRRDVSALFALRAGK